MDEEEEVEKKSGGDPTLALFLGLYLILLAFFVLLNTLATLKEDRVKAVMGSLLATFSTEILDLSNPTDFNASIGSVLAAEEFHREIREFFEVAVPLAKVDLYSGGAIMQVQLPADQMFLPGSTELRADREDLINRIARSLARNVAGRHYEFEFSTFTGPFMTEEPGSGNVLEIARAGAMARAMIRRGVPPKSLAIGAQPGNPENLELNFVLRVDEDAKVDFELDEG